MIASLNGKITEQTSVTVVIEVGGIGYEVFVPANDLAKLSIGQDAKLVIHHHIREQSQELFGFVTQAEKALFRQLITVQGVGPKAGLAVLSIGEFESVRSAIARGDAKYLQQASGVGKKTAERIIVDLADKVGVPTQLSSDFVQSELDTSDEAVEALVALGFTQTDAMVALAKVDPKLPTAERVRQALKK